MKAVIYCRVSSKEQEETGYSLPAQERLLKEYAKRKNINPIKTFSVAESASGLKQRKIFAEMMEYIEKNNVTILLCEKVDRLTRNLKEAVVANDWIEVDSMRQIHFVKQNLVIHINSRSDEKFRWDIEIVLAKKYISNLSEEVKKGQEQKILTGWLPTKPPIGYKTVGDKGHKTHVIDPDYATYVVKAFNYYASGNYSMTRLLEQLYEEGFRTHSGKKQVKSQLEKMLKDPFYYGAIRWNDTIYNTGKHEPLIDKELFNKVQDVRTRKKAPSYSKHNYQFKKLFECFECGGTVTGERQKGTVYYHCNHYRSCSQKRYVPEHEIEGKIFEVFEHFEKITPEEAEDIKQAIRANHLQEIKYKENTLRSLTEHYSKLQRRLDNLYTDKLDEVITIESWHEKQHEITSEQVQIQEQIQKLKSTEAQYFEIWLNIIDLARRAKEIYKKRSPDERRLLLSHLFSNLSLSDEKVAYTLKKPIQKLSERIKSPLSIKNTFEPKKKLTNKRQKGTSVPLCPSLLCGQDSNLRPSR